MSASIAQDAYALQDQVVAWRRDFHQHPELGFQESRTSGIVADELEQLGLTVRRNVGRTGVIGDIDVPGAKGRILLRADMDALPVQEASGEPFASQTAGCAHLCGHDAHVAMLLGAANLLARHKKDLKSSVRLMFQPSEESPPGGAAAMIDEGVLDGVDRAFAIHVFTAHESGVWGLLTGPVMAAADAIRIRVTGRGGHAATPELCVDPVVAAAQVITSLQTIMSRRIKPHDIGVLSLCMVHGGNAFNVIPDTVDLGGTLRTHSEKTKNRVVKLMRDILSGIETSYGVTIDMQFTHGYGAVINDATVIADTQTAVEHLFGPGHVTEVEKKFGGEDFCFLLDRVPGAMVFLGVGNVAKGITAAHHNPQFRIDEDVLWQGAALYTQMALNHHASD
ncbi:MAG: amidohydrolase [Planctomycetes bacterium]|nr:amidohydrolase [Planctomycetota bacterium]